MTKKEKGIIAVVVAIATIAGVALRVGAVIPPSAEWCCPYCSECLLSYDELFDHVKTWHKDERLPIVIDWD